MDTRGHAGCSQSTSLAGTPRQVLPDLDPGRKSLVLDNAVALLMGLRLFCWAFLTADTGWPFPQPVTCVRV